MGVKQSKRSVDITEASTQGEIEGFGNEGKVEKIIDGVVEKVAANGHVDGDLQNGIEPLQNGADVIQNGEAATVATEKITEKKDADESPVEGVVNGQVENGEVNGEAEKSEEAKKPDEKKEKKKEKKEKVVKKKFSLRNFSFSRKDKSKPLKEEKSAGKVDEAETEEPLTSPEKEIPSPSQEHLAETEKPKEATQPMTETSISKEAMTASAPEKRETETTPALEKVVEINSKISDDLPPPLPASPPPSEPVEGKIAADASKLSEALSEKCEISEVASSVSNVLTEKAETTMEPLTNAEQIAIETGKQIEEKATNLLKTVEERAGESMKAVGESYSQKTIDLMEGYQGVIGAEEGKLETKEEMQEAVDEAKISEGTVTAIPVEISNVGALSPKGEEPTDKHEEGAGESLADIPKDLTDEVTEAAIELSNPDSLEVSATIPPAPVVEPVTGE